MVNSGDAFCCLLFLGMPFLLGLRSLLGIRRHRLQINAGYEQMADQLGFSYNPDHNWDGNVITGTIDGYQCSVSFERKRSRDGGRGTSSGGSKNVYYTTKWTVRLRDPMTLGLEITPHAWGDGIFRRREQDIETGNDQFDKAFRVKGTDEAGIREFLTLSRMQAMLLFKLSRESQRVRSSWQIPMITDQEVIVRLGDLTPDMQMSIDTLTETIGFIRHIESG